MNRIWLVWHNWFPHITLLFYCLSKDFPLWQSSYILHRSTSSSIILSEGLFVLMVGKLRCFYLLSNIPKLLKKKCWQMYLWNPDYLSTFLSSIKTFFFINFPLCTLNFLLCVKVLNILLKNLLWKNGLHKWM